MTAIVLVGALGRMGRAVSAAAAAAGVPVAVEVDRAGTAPVPAGVWTGDWAEALAPGRVVVEFTGPEGARHAARLCAAHGAALVSGATGLTADDEAELRTASARVAVVRASNFSLGVAALRIAVRAALAALPREWDVEIVERHHRDKRDSPSGTARTLAADVLAARGLGPSVLRHGREGQVGARPADEVGIHAVRGGSWVGDHQVLLAGPGEWLELRHVAQDRAAFAHGAVAAARFASTAAPGWYTIEDVLRGPGRD
jgi:4-hydroxy-tetrahydrodipicolinate reductase